MTILPPLSALLMVMFLLFARLVMASSCAGVILGAGLWWRVWVYGKVRRELVNDEIWLWLGVGGCHFDRIWNGGLGVVEFLKKYLIWMFLMSSVIGVWRLSGCNGELGMKLSPFSRMLISSAERVWLERLVMAWVWSLVLNSFRSVFLSLFLLMVGGG